MHLMHLPPCRLQSPRNIKDPSQLLKCLLTCKSWIIVRPRHCPSCKTKKPNLDSAPSTPPPARRCPCCSTALPLSLRSFRPCFAGLDALGLGRQPPGRRADRYPAAFKEPTCSATLRLMNLLTARDTKGDIAAGILEMRIYLLGAFQMLCTTLGLQVVPNGQRWHQE